MEVFLNDSLGRSPEDISVSRGGAPVTMQAMDLIGSYAYQQDSVGTPGLRVIDIGEFSV
jgi:hypothetical protein